jgi:hypothetical protein
MQILYKTPIMCLLPLHAEAYGNRIPLGQKVPVRLSMARVFFLSENEF